MKKKNVVKEDAVVANTGATVSGDIQSTSGSGIKAGDILGNCDHEKDGYMKDGCFHIPAKVTVPFRRWETVGGSKRKRDKFIKLKKYAYSQGTKVVTDLFETNTMEFSKDKIFKRLRKISTTVKSENDIKNISNIFDKNKDTIVQKMNSSKYSEIKQLFLNFGLFLKDIVTGNYKASWFTISMVAVGLIYVFSPIDIIPDAILGVGIIDDVFVIKLIYSAIEDEFNKWKNIKNI